MILRLHSEGWIPGTWDDYIPPGIWTDYIDGDYEAPGPDGTLIHGALRPVFFIQSEFEAWLKETFGAEAKLDRAPMSPNPRVGTRVVDGVIEAVRALWGKSPPAGLNAHMRMTEINDWLSQNGRLKASLQTIRRAFALIRAERT
jgi:hypothetical protein